MASLVRSLSKVALLTGLQLNSDYSLPPPPQKKKGKGRKAWVLGLKDIQKHFTIVKFQIIMWTLRKMIIWIINFHVVKHAKSLF